jgi:hypothetical protein
MSDNNIKFETIINNIYQIRYVNFDELCQIQDYFRQSNIIPDECLINGELVYFREPIVLVYPEYENYIHKIKYFFGDGWIPEHVKHNMQLAITGFWGQKLATYYALGTSDALLEHDTYTKELFRKEAQTLVNFLDNSEFGNIDLINDTPDEINDKFEEYRDTLYDWDTDLYNNISINFINIILYLSVEKLKDSIVVNRSYSNNFVIDYNGENFFKSFTVGESYHNIGKTEVGYSGYDNSEYFVLPKGFPVINANDMADTDEIILNIRDCVKVKPSALKTLR